MATTTATIEQERRGLALPAIRGIGGYFASKDRYATAWGDLLLALFTPIGTRPGNRAFGSPLHGILFEPDVDRQQSLVRYVVQETAERWCPHLRIRGTRAQRSGKVIRLWIGFNLVDDEHLERKLIEIHPNEVLILTAQGV